VSTSNAVLVQSTDPALANWITAIPNALSIDQNYTVVMSVSNVGIVSAPSVVPDPIVPVLGSTLVSGPNPGSADIDVGAVQDFSWVFAGSSTTGTDVITGLARSSTFVSTHISDGSSNSVTVFAPPDLSTLFMEILMPPSVVSVGQDITVAMTVSNTGETDAVNVTPQSLVKAGTGNAVPVSGPLPSAATVPAGGHASFTWVRQAYDDGTLAYNDYAIGQDARTLVYYTSVSHTSSPITIESPADLTTSLVINESSINVGQDVTVVMTVVNNGQADALNVSPSPLTNIITSPSDGGMVPVSGPLPLSRTVAGGTSETFTWVYNATAAGSVTLEGSSSGTDENSGLTDTSPKDRKSVV